MNFFKKRKKIHQKTSFFCTFFPRNSPKFTPRILGGQIEWYTPELHLLKRWILLLFLEILWRKCPRGKISAQKNFFLHFRQKCCHFFFVRLLKIYKIYVVYKRLQSKTYEKVKKWKSKKKNRKFRNPGKKWRGFFAGFFCVFLTFSDPQKTPKINDYSPEHPFFGKTGKWEFREFREIPGNFLPEFSRREFFSTIFLPIFINFYNFIIVYSR